MNLVEFAEVANDATNIGWLLLAAVLVLILAFLGAVWFHRKTRNLPKPPPRSVGHQRLDLEEERDIHPPTQLGAVERILRDDAARYDTDATERMYRHINGERD